MHHHLLLWPSLLAIGRSAYFFLFPPMKGKTQPTCQLRQMDINQPDLFHKHTLAALWNYLECYMSPRVPSACLSSGEVKWTILKRAEEEMNHFNSQLSKYNLSSLTLKTYSHKCAYDTTLIK